MRNSKVIFICCACVLLMSQCRKKGELIETYSFSAQDKQAIPYHMGDTFTLVDSLGSDSLEFQVLTLRSENFEQFEVNITDHYFDQDHYDWYDTENITMSSSGNFTIYLSFSNPFKGAVKKIITFNLNLQSHSEISWFSGFCILSEGTIYQANVSDFENSESILLVSHIDTLNICNKQFFSVFRLSPSCIQSGSNLYLTEVFYSIEKGLVGIRTNDARVWSLEQ